MLLSFLRDTNVGQDLQFPTALHCATNESFHKPGKVYTCPAEIATQPDHNAALTLVFLRV